MDCKFCTAEGIFSFRVGFVIVRNGLLLAIREDSGSYYLPGGKVHMQETMEEALRREAWEELGVKIWPHRPLWFCERSFSHNGRQIHELSAYFLGELEWDGFPGYPQPFVRQDTDGQAQHFVWLSLEDMDSVQLFPTVLQENFRQLPERLTLNTDVRYGSGPKTVDIKFPSDEGLFNFRVAGVFVHEGRLLAMKEDDIDHYYLPGGRVCLHEAMKEALRREIDEELGVSARVIRPLWLCESFFALNGSPVHEIAMYYLAELDWERLPALGGSFRRADTDGDEHIFQWLTEDEVRSQQIYPIPLQKCFPQLPVELTFFTDTRDRLER